MSHNKEEPRHDKEELSHKKEKLSQDEEKLRRKKDILSCDLMCNGLDYDKERKKIFSKTKKNMIALGTYRAEFDVIILRYAEMRLQSDMLHKRWYNEGCVITEEYTNNDGATNERKTALYMAIEKLRSELTKMETLFGMTPKGLKDIRKKGLEQKKESALDKMLGG